MGHVRECSRKIELFEIFRLGAALRTKPEVTRLSISVSEMMQARSIAFSSSRTLPGQ
jgi:hypothetical protein